MCIRDRIRLVYLLDNPGSHGLIKFRREARPVPICFRPFPGISSIQALTGRNRVRLIRDDDNIKSDACLGEVPLQDGAVFNDR